mgnify:CR=1 FL=1
MNWTNPRQSISLPSTFLQIYSHEVASRWYKAPELLLGTRQSTPAIDMWALGCVVAEWLSGGALMAGGNDIDQLARIFSTVGTPLETETEPENADANATDGNNNNSKADTTNVTENSFSVGFVTETGFPFAPVPCRRTWPSVVTLLDYTKITFPPSAGRDWTETLPTADPAAVDFVARLLVLDPVKRMTAEQARQHPFVTGNLNTRTGDNADTGTVGALWSCLDVRNSGADGKELVASLVKFSLAANEAAAATTVAVAVAHGHTQGYGARNGGDGASDDDEDEDDEGYSNLMYANDPTASNSNVNTGRSLNSTLHTPTTNATANASASAMTTTLTRTGLINGSGGAPLFTPPRPRQQSVKQALGNDDSKDGTGKCCCRGGVSCRGRKSNASVCDSFGSYRTMSDVTVNTTTSKGGVDEKTVFTVALNSDPQSCGTNDNKNEGFAMQIDTRGHVSFTLPSVTPTVLAAQTNQGQGSSKHKTKKKMWQGKCKNAQKGSAKSNFSRSECCCLQT